MQSNKRFFRLLLVLALVALMLSTFAVLAQDETQTLTVSYPGNTAAPVIAELIDDYIEAKAAEGITVEIVQNAPPEGYEDQLVLDFSAGVGPDVYMMSAERIPEFVITDLIRPLDDLVAEWEDWDQFPQGMKDMPSMNGSVYAVMTQTDTRVLFYRSDILEAAGVEMPFEPTSWDEIFTTAATIQENVEDVIPMEVEAGTIWGEGTTMDGFFMLFRGAGGVLLDPEDGKWIVESPAILDAFSFYETMFGEDYSRAEPFMEPEPWVFWLQEGIPNGDVGMAVAVNVVWDLYAPEGPWGIENRDEVLAWTPMPAKEPGAGINGLDYVGMGGGWGWSMSSMTEKEDLAWDFIQFMTSAQSASDFIETFGGLPSRLDAATDNEFVAELTEQVMPYQSFRPLSPDYSRVSEQIQIATERILLGEATAEEAMALFAEAVEGIVGADNVKRITE